MDSNKTTSMKHDALVAAAAELGGCGMMGAALLPSVLAMQQDLIAQTLGSVGMVTEHPPCANFAPAPLTGHLLADTPMHWTTGGIPRSFEDIDASLTDNPNEGKLSFSAAEMRMVLAAWKAEATLGQKYREMVYTNCLLPASTDQIALDAAGEIMAVVSRQYPPGGPTQIKAGVQGVVAAAIVRSRTSRQQVTGNIVISDPDNLLCKPAPQPSAEGLAAVRKWTLLLTGTDKGLVGEFGKRWPGEEGYDHIDVVEVSPAAMGVSDKSVSIGQAYGVAPEVVEMILRAAA